MFRSLVGLFLWIFSDLCFLWVAFFIKEIILDSIYFWNILLFWELFSKIFIDFFISFRVYSSLADIVFKRFVGREILVKGIVYWLSGSW